MIKKLTDREHILTRPNMYIGSIINEKHNIHIWENNKFVKKDIVYNPGLVKIFEEILDNSIDAFIRNNLPKNAKINITLEKDYYIVEDNGSGIPIKKNADSEYLPYVAWGYAKAGSNFTNTRSTIGTNGVGSYLTNVYSKKFIGETWNNGKYFKGVWQNNAKDYKELIKTKAGNGTKVSVYPDFERFGLKEFTENEFKVIFTRLIMIALTYPEIKIILNKKQIKIKEFNF